MRYLQIQIAQLMPFYSDQSHTLKHNQPIHGNSNIKVTKHCYFFVNCNEITSHSLNS